MERQLHKFDEISLLVEQCRKQNSFAQRFLFDKYYEKMYAVCLRYFRNEEEASDVINRAFLKVFDKIKQYKAEGSLGAWIKRIVINTAIDYIRSNKEYKKRFIAVEEFSLYGFPKENDADNDVFAVMGEHFSKEDLFNFVSDLPPATRAVFNLYAIDEFKHKEIAQQLKISEGTSKWHLANARKLLSERIKKEWSKKKNYGKRGFTNR